MNEPLSENSGSSTRDLIDHALSVMSDTDLNPTITRKKRDKGHRPAVYGATGEPPLWFDADQGWEIATKQGARLDLAIRNVGSAVETRATLLRDSSALTLEEITAQRRELNQRRLNLLGAERADAEDLSDALRIGPTSGDITFSSQAEYEEHVESTLAHVVKQLRAQEALVPGDGKDDVLDFNQKPAYEKARNVLKAEVDRFIPGDGGQSAWVMHEARLDSQARIRALSEVREMGGSYPEGFLIEKPSKRRAPRDSDTVAKRIFATTAAVLPNDWIDSMGGRNQCLRVEMGTPGSTSRWMSSSCRGGRTAPEVRITPDTYPTQGPMLGYESDALHEIGHHMEFTYPEINQIARTHKALRTTGDDGRLDSIEAIIPGTEDSLPARPERMDTTNDLDGWGRPGSFAITYAGQETGPSASEVFSTGLEAALGGRYGALRGRGGVAGDSEHLNLVLGILATVGRR